MAFMGGREEQDGWGSEREYRWCGGLAPELIGEAIDEFVARFAGEVLVDDNRRPGTEDIANLSPV